MIAFNFNLRNPWSNRFENLWNRAYNTPFKNKHIELEITRDYTLVSFMFNWTIRQSHSGLNIEIGLFGYNAHFNFYDSRHWDNGKNQYEIYPDEG
jgi:hypothetical protein